MTENNSQRSLLLWRRTPVLAVLSALLVVLTLASSCRLGGPAGLVDEGADKRLDNSFTEENHAVILEYLDSNFVRPQFGGKVFSAYHILGSSSNRIYVWALCEEYTEGAGGELERGSGVSMPVVLSFEIRDSLVYVTGHKNPRDGSLYAVDIRSLFPRELHEQVFNIQQGDVIERLSERVENRARKAFDIPPPTPDWSHLISNSQPAPTFAIHLTATVNPGYDLISPDGRWLLVGDRGIAALPLTPDRKPVRLYRAEPSYSLEDYLVIERLGWISETECYFLTCGLQKDGPHKGQRGAALFRGNIVDGQAIEVGYFDLPQGLYKSVAWDRVSQKVCLHVGEAIWEFDIAGGVTRRVREVPSYDGLFQAIPSPDGTKFVYNLPEQGKTALAVRDNRTGHETGIHADGQAISFYPVWSPDSRYVAAFMATRKPVSGDGTEGEFDIVPHEDGPYPASRSFIVYDALTESATVYRAGDTWLMCPVWASDSSRLFFMGGSVEIDNSPDMGIGMPSTRYDSLWTAVPGDAGSLVKVADLSSIFGEEEPGTEFISLMAAMPGGRGAILQKSQYNSGESSIWYISCDAEPVMLVAGSLNSFQSHPTDGSVVSVVQVGQEYEVWVFAVEENGITASKIASLGKVDDAHIFSYRGDLVYVVLSDFEPQVSVLAAYNVGRQPGTAR